MSQSGYNGYKGILLEQNKEPLLSRGIRQLEKLPVEERFFLDSRVDPSNMTPERLVIAARQAQIVDECDGTQLWKKLESAVNDPRRAIVVDALDDEPYISSQLCIALWMPGELEETIDLLCNQLKIERAVVEIYRNLTDIGTSIPKKIGDYRVRRVGGTYPAEKRVRRNESRILKVGACALIHLYRAVFKKQIQTTSFVSVAGDCIANPANYEVPLNATVGQVLDAAGLIAQPKRVVVGGSMTGTGIDDPENVRVLSATRGILAFAEQFEDFGFSCIGCGRCVDVCPQGLSPYFIFKFLRAHQKAIAQQAAQGCTCCGACSYICPAKLDLSHRIYLAASEGRRQKEKP